MLAHVIRALPGKAPHGDWHYHDCRAQFVYVLKGWVKMQYEGGKPIVMKAGSCFFQPPRIKHRELAHSRDLEMLEVVAPGDFKTYGGTSGQTPQGAATGQASEGSTNDRNAPARPASK